jgi:hypothetical protein
VEGGEEGGWRGGGEEQKTGWRGGVEGGEEQKRQGGGGVEGGVEQKKGGLVAVTGASEAKGSKGALSKRYAPWPWPWRGTHHQTSSGSRGWSRAVAVCLLSVSFRGVSSSVTTPSQGEQTVFFLKRDFNQRSAGKLFFCRNVRCMRGWTQG